MNERSLRVLEFTKIRAQLAQYCVSDMGRALCDALTPSNRLEDVLRMQQETEEAHSLLSYLGGTPMLSFSDVHASLHLAQIGSSLSPRALMEIGASLRAARAAREAIVTDRQDTPLMSANASRLSTFKDIEQAISDAIISEDEIADRASNELFQIRRKMRACNERVRERLNGMIHNPNFQKYLQDAIITMRADRYVLPVRQEYRSMVPGIVHDQSSTGATVFIEPMSVVEIGNELKQLISAEKVEIEKILRTLSAQIAPEADAISDNLAILAQLDFAFAKASLAKQMNGCMPKINREGRLNIVRGRHPLIDPQKVVPLDIRLGSDFTTLIITGPNTGGKTVTLKTTGLFTLMAQSGLQIPAEYGTELAVFDDVFADIGDEQSIEQSLSTFSAHMKNIVDIVADCDRDTLVLFDELGAGTDPAEGAALANALIEFCRQCGSRVAATTHYAELKLYAMRTEGVMNASCEFDVETLRPTYRLLIGIPGKSNAFAISCRLGLPEPIIDKAKSLVNENDRNFEDVLNQLEQQRQQMEAAKLEAERLRQETEQMKEKSEAYYAEIKREREKAVRTARAEAQSIIDDARRTSNEVADELKQLRKQLRENADVQGSNAKQTELRRRLNEAEDRLAGHDDTPKPRPQAARAIRVGDTVELVRFGTRASVLAINKDGSYLLQAGIMKVTAQPDEVYLIEETKQQAKKIIARSQRAFRSAGASTELDLRGMSADEAIATLDIFLDNAMMANLASVRIIHGKGTGVLRKAVQDELKRNRCVKRYRLGVYGEGEDGVTIAELA